MKRLTAMVACATLVFCGACGGGDGEAEAGKNRNGAGTAPAGSTGPGRLDAEIQRLERQVERNPADAASSDELSDAYVRRGDARRAAQQLKEALEDYRRALKFNPDNEEAQRHNVELSPLVEGTPQPGEFGEPAPLPITPNVMGEGAASPSPTPRKP
jgi:hypothetical protein